MLGDQWDDLPDELRGRWARMLVHCRRARLLAYRVRGAAERRAGCTPGRRRGLPHRGDPARPGQRRGADRDRRAGRRWTARQAAGSAGRWRTTGATRRPSTVASGSIEMQRILLARSCSLAASMNIELSEEAAEYGRQARRALEAAGGDRLVQLAEHEPGRREAPGGPGPRRAGRVGPRSRGDSGDELEAAAALCRSAGYWAVPYPVAERLCRPADLDVDGLVVVADVVPAAAVAGLDLRWAAVDARRSPQPRRPPARRRRAAARRPPSSPRLDLGPLDDVHGDGSTWPSGWSCRAGRCSGCSTGPWS